MSPGGFKQTVAHVKLRGSFAPLTPKSETGEKLQHSHSSGSSGLMQRKVRCTAQLLLPPLLLPCSAAAGGCLEVQSTRAAALTMPGASHTAVLTPA